MSSDAEIAAIQNDLAAIEAKMKEARRKFVEATSRLFTGWCMSEAERYVKQDSIQTKSLGTAKLSELKMDVQQLENKMPQVVAGTVDVDHIWQVGGQDNSFPYCGPNCKKAIEYDRKHCTGGYSPRPPYHPSQLEVAIGSVTVHLSSLLIKKYGYKSHVLSPPWSDEMEAACLEYNSLAEHFDSLSKRLSDDAEALKRKKLEREASDLWDKA